MKITVVREDDVTVASLDGSLDALTTPEATTALEKALEDGPVQMILDMESVSYMSSAGLRMLLNLLKAARGRDGDLRLAAVGQDVQKVLQMSGFQTIIQSYPDVAAATASFA